MNDASHRPPALCIHGDFNIFTAMPLKDELLRLITEAPSGTELAIDLFDVTDIDSAGLQLMLFAQREASAQDKRLSFIRLSPPVQELLTLCDLAPLFILPVPTSSPA